MIESSRATGLIYIKPAGMAIDSLLCVPRDQRKLGHDALSWTGQGRFAGG
jgi:hypothetical protein